MTKETARKFSLEDKSISNEVRFLMIDLIRHCPFCLKNKSDLHHPSVYLKKDDDGWFFTCQVCYESQCSGYLKNKPR